MLCLLCKCSIKRRPPKLTSLPQYTNRGQVARVNLKHFGLQFIVRLICFCTRFSEKYCVTAADFVVMATRKYFLFSSWFPVSRHNMSIMSQMRRILRCKQRTPSSDKNDVTADDVTRSNKTVNLLMRNDF